MSHDELAAVFLVLVTAVPFVWAFVALVRSPFTLPQSILFFGAVLLTRILWRARLPERLPLGPRQGAVVVCNHRSSIDPFFIQVLFDRPIHWMVAREYCQHRAFRWFLRTCEVIPVGRGGIDTAATKAAIRYAAEGGLVGMLPEGRINVTDQFMLPVRPGAALVALKARVPILPCYIQGSPYDRTSWSPLLMPARVRLTFGELIDLSTYYDRRQEEGVVEEIMLRVVAAIASLAGQTDFQPQMAGRRWKPTE